MIKIRNIIISCQFLREKYFFNRLFRSEDNENLMILSRFHKLKNSFIYKE